MASHRGPASKTYTPTFSSLMAFSSGVQSLSSTMWEKAPSALRTMRP